MSAARTIAEIVTSAAEHDFVGRAAEVGAIRDAARRLPGGPAVLAISGPGGIGKSRLLRTALGRLGAGTDAVLIDCRDVEPTPQGMTEALAAAAGLPAGAPLPAALAALAPGGRPSVLALDTYERLGLLDAWMRRELVPALPVTALTILCGRDGPGTAWLTAPGWAGLVAELRLGPLSQSEAMTLLRARGLTQVQAARANAFARGHPLALELAAAALRADPGRDIDAGPPPAVMRQLLDAVLDGLPDRTIETLQAASTSRRVTEPILGALLARAGVRDAFDALRALPFVEETGEGLAIHDVVREALATDLRERDPERHARLRRRAWSYFETRAGTPSPERLRAVTADLISLIRNPVLRAACFPDGASGHAVERAEPRDGPAIRAIVEAREPPGAAAGLMRWWERQPGTFSVARGPGGEVAALLHLCEWEDVDDALLRDDAVARAWRFHMADHPPLPGTRVLTMRRWLGRDPGELLSPAVGACWLDVKRSHMELRPRLSRLYSAMARPDALAPIFEPLGFAPVGRPVDVGGAPQQPVWLDFGPGSVEGWLRRLVGAEVAGEEAAAAVDATAPAARLSRREAEVLGLIGEGYTNRAIAARLVISEKTAGRHVENIFCKLGVHNRAQAVRVGTQMGRSPDAARGAAP